MSVPETMEDPPQMVITQPQKRPLEDEAPSTPKKSAPPSDAGSSPLTVLSTIASPSSLKLSRTVEAGASASSSAQPPTKKRKLTTEEKEAQKLEKDAKAKVREEKKAQKELEEKLKAEKKAEKDEQKRIKDEEKRVKDEEKRRKAEEREEKKRAKEMEQLQKEEEQRKKERSQMKLGAFFGKKPSEESTKTATVDSIKPSAPVTASLQSDVPMPDANAAVASPQKAIQKTARCDYESYFLPFQIPSRAILAPHNRYMDDPAKLAAATSRLDAFISQEDVHMEPIPKESLRSKFASTSRGGPNIPLMDIVARINGSSDHPIDLTQEADRRPLELLNEVPMKYIHFGEDVRPPYYGTYTKPHNSHEAAYLARNPCSRTLHEVDYDYDSEAEWEEPEEGEDLDSDGDEDLESEGDDDMEGFLDDEDDAQVKRRLIGGGDLQPISTGLCWEDANGVSRLNDGSGAISTEFKDFQMGFLLTPHPQSIEPFSTAYWAPDPTPTIKHNSSPGSNIMNSLMQPPRMPLSQRPANGLLNPASRTPAPGAKPKAAKAPGRMVSAEQLPAFKEAIQGSDLTKIAMIESLKKQFPNLKKDEITNTLSAVAVRSGPTQAEKRWSLV